MRPPLFLLLLPVACWHVTKASQRFGQSADTTLWECTVAPLSSDDEQPNGQSTKLQELLPHLASDEQPIRLSLSVQSASYSVVFFSHNKLTNNIFYHN
jgi:hypothetical protein